MQKPLIPALLLLLLVFFGCSKTTDTPEGNADLWKVAYFLDDDDKIEDTAIFTGYTFEFNPQNEMIIHLPAGTSEKAVWDTAQDISQFSMKMITPFAPVDKILGDWTITEQTTTVIKLQKSIDISPNAFDVKTLHLEKQ